MIRSLWIAKTGMEAQQTQLDTISQQPGQRRHQRLQARRTSVFEDLMYQNLRQAGAASSDQTQLPTGLQVGLGVRAVATSRNFSQGNLQQTRNNLDIAIKGHGFFQIQLPDGTHRLHPRRLVPGRRAAASSSPTTATWCSPASRFRPMRRA